MNHQDMTARIAAIDSELAAKTKLVAEGRSANARVAAGQGLAVRLGHRPMFLETAETRIAKLKEERLMLQNALQAPTPGRSISR